MELAQKDFQDAFLFSVPVNNVGVMYDFPDVLLNISQQKLWQLIHVNIGAATIVSRVLFFFLKRYPFFL